MRDYPVRGEPVHKVRSYRQTMGLTTETRSQFASGLLDSD